MATVFGNSLRHGCARATLFLYAIQGLRLRDRPLDKVSKLFNSRFLELWLELLQIFAGCANASQRTVLED